MDFLKRSDYSLEVDLAKKLDVPTSTKNNEMNSTNTKTYK